MSEKPWVKHWPMEPGNGWTLSKLVMDRENGVVKEFWKKVPWVEEPEEEEDDEPMEEPMHEEVSASSSASKPKNTEKTRCPPIAWCPIGELKAFEAMKGKGKADKEDDPKKRKLSEEAGKEEAAEEGDAGRK